MLTGLRWIDPIARKYEEALFSFELIRGSEKRSSNQSLELGAERRVRIRSGQRFAIALEENGMYAFGNDDNFSKRGTGL